MLDNGKLELKAEFLISISKIKLFLTFYTN